MQLSEQQLNHFRTFGFLIFRQLLSSDEVEQYRREFDSGMEAWRNNGQQQEGTRLWAPLMDANTPFISSLLDDPRFADVAEQLLGKPVVGILTDGNYYVGDTQWHPDTVTLEAIKFTVYLDPLDANSGALRVIPGSHRESLHGQMVRGDTQAVFGVRPDEIPAYVFESKPDDVLVFKMAIWHAAFGGSNHRRMGTVDYYEDPTTPEATLAFQKELGRHVQGYLQKWGSAKQHYPPYWRSINNPRHQRWVRRLAELTLLDNPAPVS